MFFCGSQEDVEPGVTEEYTIPNSTLLLTYQWRTKHSLNKKQQITQNAPFLPSWIIRLIITSLLGFLTWQEKLKCFLHRQFHKIFLYSLFDH